MKQGSSTEDYFTRTEREKVTLISLQMPELFTN